MSPRVGAVLEPQGFSVPETLERAALVEDLGLSSLWLVQMPGQWDGATILAALAERTKRMTLGSAILPLYSRPPVVMASTAITLDELSRGRFALGLGLGHRGVGEWMVGAGAAPPAVPATREYLRIVLGAIRDGEVDHDGEWFSGHVFYPDSQARRSELPVYLGAFGPKMLELAGEVADGALLWMCTPEYVRDTAMPALRRGWERRSDGRYPGGAGFDVAVLLSAAVTPDPAADRARFGDYLANYLRVPTYRRLFTASGFGAQLAAGRADEAMIHGLGAIGDAAEVGGRIETFAAAGATQILISPTAGAFSDREQYLATVRVAVT
ncbi:LLM class flavin-dependent oxidoreductase [Nonomuraea sp. NPDC050451]|uniref:LLM class flavin-dependent oxidoreductase n=1 Tax=Nonomuraea sp. NPDC050451 TaxID=3364364 RepID=UPI0037BAE7A9